MMMPPNAHGRWKRRQPTGGVAPTITVAPVVAWAVEIGQSPAITPPTYTGDAGTITYTLKRDGAAVGAQTDRTEAQAETYAAVAADIGPSLRWDATVTNASGSGSANSNAVTFAHATYLPATAIGVSTSGLTTADNGTTVDQWAASLGGIACTLEAPAATNRPAYSASGGVGARPLVTFDGTDNGLDGPLTKGSAFANCELGFVGSRVAFGVAGALAISYSATGTTPHFSLQGASAAALRFSGGANVNTTTDPDGTTAHYSGDALTGTWNARVAGTIQNTGSASVTSRADGGGLSLGSRVNAASQWGNFALQAWYCGPALTSDQRTHLRALLTYHTGVAC